MATTYDTTVSFEYGVTQVTPTGQPSVTLDGQKTRIAGQIKIELESWPVGSGQKSMIVDLSGTMVSASGSGSMACNDSDRGRYWYTEKVEVTMSLSGSASSSMQLSDVATGCGSAVSDSSGTTLGPSLGSDTGPVPTGFVVSDQSDSSRAYVVYQLISTPDVSYKDASSLKHVHSGLNSGMVTIWSVADPGDPAIANLWIGAKAQWQTSTAKLTSPVTLNLKITHSLAKVALSKHKSTLETQYHTAYGHASYTFMETVTVDLSRVS